MDAQDKVGLLNWKLGYASISPSPEIGTKICSSELPRSIRRSPAVCLGDYVIGRKKKEEENVKNASFFLGECSGGFQTVVIFNEEFRCGDGHRQRS